MKRESVEPREGWEQRLADAGMNYAVMFGSPYWNETACYQFMRDEILKLESATNELHSMCLDAVDKTVSKGDYSAFNLPCGAIELIERSWRAKQPSLYGRFDIAYGLDGAIKMLEYNADTPTALLEASVCQWHWVEDRKLPDQFNSIHERLIERWKLWAGNRIHFTTMTQEDAPDDIATINYLRDTAAQAGVTEHWIPLEGIQFNGWNFLDTEGSHIEHCFKLYPWEWMLADEFGKHASACQWLEPPWKLLLSNKSILPVLWGENMNHPLLLESHFDKGDSLSGDWVKKPVFSREGCNVSVLQNGMEIERSPDFREAYEGRYVIQKMFPLPSYDKRYPIIGCWVIGDESAGIGIREDTDRITAYNNQFVPHYFY